MGFGVDTVYGWSPIKAEIYRSVKENGIGGRITPTAPFMAKTHPVSALRLDQTHKAHIPTGLQLYFQNSTTCHQSGSSSSTRIRSD